MAQESRGFAGSRAKGASKTFQERAVSRPQGLESVIEGDDRVPVDDASAFPWRMVCALQITGRNGVTVPGTGWLAGPSTVVTAGHCVFDAPGLGGLADRIVVLPGRQGQVAPFELDASRFRPHPRWRDSGDIEFDIAAMKLPSSVGNELGFFAAAVRQPADLRAHLAHISGYPQVPGNGLQQFHHRQSVTEVLSRRLFYTVDTSEGQSGAPVWIVDVDGGPPLVVGVHAHGNEDTPLNLRPANSATLVNPEILQQIQAWVAEDVST